MAERRIRADGVVPSDASVKIFTNIIADAYTSLLKIFEQSNFTNETARQLMKKVDEVVEEADANTQAWVRTQVPAFYEKGLFQTIESNATQEVGSTVKIGFASFHKEAILALSEETYLNIAEGMRGLRQTGYGLVQSATKQKVVEGLGSGRIQGDTLKTIQKNIVKELKKDGISALRDRGGKTWSLERYGEMLARTKLTQAHNVGVVNKMAENQDDLVLISQHWGSCELCAPFEGRILSVSGRSRTYPSLEDAEADGLFHPNCKHTMTPYHNEYLESSQIWDSQEGKYVPFNERRVWNGEDFVPLNTIE